jgi:hypothetical protein
MQLSESQLRSVIREELQQYLVEQGFFQKIGSGIKSAYQKLTGGGQTSTTQSATTQAQTTPSAAPPVNPNVAKQVRDQKIIDRQQSGEYGPTIQNGNDIMKARRYYLQLLNTSKKEQALREIFNNLTANITHRKERGQSLNSTEIAVYKIFITNIENKLKNVIKENQEQIQTIIPNTLLAGYLSVLYKDVINNEIMTADEFKRVMNITDINLKFQNLKRLIAGNQ